MHILISLLFAFSQYKVWSRLCATLTSTGPHLVLPMKPVSDHMTSRLWGLLGCSDYMMTCCLSAGVFKLFCCWFYISDRRWGVTLNWIWKQQSARPLIHPHTCQSSALNQPAAFRCSTHSNTKVLELFQWQPQSCGIAYLFSNTRYVQITAKTTFLLSGF